MPNDTDLYNASHPEWSIYAMISLNERKAYQRLLDVGLVDIMSTYLPPHTYTRWENTLRLSPVSLPSFI
jgi:exonuclease III